ncbi:MAG: UvrD-helicase domain-containing protein [Clostridia bacterium]|nr:UvrD-helicase domain-containing protein [Clostridia bacterium]
MKIIDIIKNFILKQNLKKRQLTEKCTELLNASREALSKIDALFSNKKKDIDVDRANDLLNQYAHLTSEYQLIKSGKYRKAKNHKELLILLNAYIEESTKLSERIGIHNSNVFVDKYINQMASCINDAEALFTDKAAFIDPILEDNWREKYIELLNDLIFADTSRYKNAAKYSEFSERSAKIQRIGSELHGMIQTHNDFAADLKISDAYKILGDVEGHRLDRQQMHNIVKEVSNQLVIAGAGTGKTTTIIGKIKYLLSTGKYSPDDFLVLSFTNASASEMNERLSRETNSNISVCTFHKLGLNIITEIEEKPPKISQLNLAKFIRERLRGLMLSESYLSELVKYLTNNRVVSKDEFEFKNYGEYENYLKFNPPTTLRNEIVKSYGEMYIANFLTQNGINYIYECPYEIDTRTDEYTQYTPDFYLPDQNIYIEFFGINRNGNVPPYFKGSHGKSANDAYRESMEWKRLTHRNNSTTMIECFAYEQAEGILISELKRKLTEAGVTLCPKSTQELWDELKQNESSILDGLIELFETFINLTKSNDYTLNQIKDLNIDHKRASDNASFLNLVEPVYDAYCAHLKSFEEIDFNDMINTASHYIRDGLYKNPYRFIVVDEYQDISKARYNLLKLLRSSSNCKIFCVGDDWQSIYRFAGSDIGFILNFERYWGKADIGRIETTYRFPLDLINISSAFIMKNPAQLSKKIKGVSSSFEFPFGEIQGYNEHYAIAFTIKKLDELPKNSTVFFIGRYSFDRNILNNHPDLSCSYENGTGIIVKYRNRPDLMMQYLTAHKSKGLQADYVFIINNKNARMGFPSKIQDSPILDLLLEKNDPFPCAEERRLYYVALTRAKTKVYIVTVKGHESDFVRELKLLYSAPVKRNQYRCPICGGKLLLRKGPYGNFFGCQNYKKLNCKYIKKIKG